MNRSLKSIIFTVLCGCSLLQQSCSKLDTDVDTLISLNDGIMTIPVIPGSFMTSDCGSIIKGMEAQEYACIAFPMSSEGIDGKDWDTDYSNALIADGWAFAGGEANVYYFEKPLNSDCSHKLYMLGWYQSTAEQDKIYEETGNLEGVENLTFIFTIDDELVCGESRQADKFK